MRYKPRPVCRRRGDRSPRAGPRRLPRSLAALLAAALAAPGHALVVANDDEAATQSAPPDGAVWANVANFAGMSAVYLGHGWLITAGHAKVGTVSLDGAAYAPVPDSTVRLGNGDGESKTDLLLFRVDPKPDLPRLPIVRESPRPGEPLLLVGCGRGRGEEILWQGIPGFRWDLRSVRRWGTNHAGADLLDVEASGTKTRSFQTQFDPPATIYEAQASPGDSGGAAFVKRDGTWWLAGVVFSVGEFSGQLKQTALVGNRTYIADLNHYREQILRIIEPH